MAGLLGRSACCCQCQSGLMHRWMTSSAEQLSSVPRTHRRSAASKYSLAASIAKLSVPAEDSASSKADTKEVQPAAAPHTPVLLQPILDAFQHMKIKTYVDGTLGAGGHATAILEGHPVSVNICSGVTRAGRTGTILVIISMRISHPTPTPMFQPLWLRCPDVLARTRTCIIATCRLQHLYPFLPLACRARIAATCPASPMA